jgi:flagellar hook-basal body complex protein FliE
MAIGPASVSPLHALQAYRTAMANVGTASSGATPSVATPAAGGFGDMVQSALKGVVDQSHTAEQQSMAAISGHGDLMDVVSAVSQADLSLQTTLAVRDRVVQAYQDIMRMPI